MSLLKVHPADNVAVALTALEAGRKLEDPGSAGGALRVVEAIPALHKIALTNLAEGRPVIRYGQTIGLAARPIPRGSWVHSHNLAEPELQAAAVPGPPVALKLAPLAGPAEFLGFARPQGRAGTRNHLLVLPTVACAVGTAEAVVIEHGLGCGRVGPDFERTRRAILGCAQNPNAGAVLLIGLGCEIHPGRLYLDDLGRSRKPFEFLEIQAEGGSRKTAAKGIDLARKLADHLALQGRTPQPGGDLVVGLECGGSDALSGVTANPCAGLVSDWVVSQGGTVILAETTEMIGAEHLLEQRAASAEVAADIARIVDKSRALTRLTLGPAAHLAVAPGNMDGGLSTIMEKSLGCITKGGQTTVTEVLDFAQPPTRKGLVIMDTPGYDAESLGGLVSGGCQMILFTTGRGNPLGAPLVPVIKIASNSRVAEHMADDIDVNAGLVADGRQTLPQAAQTLLDTFFAVAQGRLSRAEANHQELGAWSMTLEAL
jgi:altronate dehydratase large subunit